MESTSSMNMTQGARRRARVNTALAFFSDSPSHLFSTQDASTERKVAPPSVATAFANIVFPVFGKCVCVCVCLLIMMMNTYV